MNRIKEVNFGFADAITEAERNPKNFDLSFFDPHDYLTELVHGTRFEVALDRKIDLEEMWEEIFPASINEKQSGDYVLENLIYRPRDVLVII